MCERGRFQIRADLVLDDVRQSFNVQELRLVTQGNPPVMNRQAEGVEHLKPELRDPVGLQLILE